MATCSTRPSSSTITFAAPRARAVHHHADGPVVAGAERARVVDVVRLGRVGLLRRVVALGPADGRARLMTCERARREGLAPVVGGEERRPVVLAALAQEVRGAAVGAEHGRDAPRRRAAARSTGTPGAGTLGARGRAAVRARVFMARVGRPALRGPRRWPASAAPASARRPRRRRRRPRAGRAARPACRSPSRRRRGTRRRRGRRPRARRRSPIWSVSGVARRSGSPQVVAASVLRRISAAISPPSVNTHAT